MVYTDEEGQRLAAEFMAKPAAHPVQNRYLVATESSTTERGGQVVATSGISTVGGRVALVGDVVRYPDGSETSIVSGAGVAMIYRGKPAAVVGSELENSDRINGPAHNDLTFVPCADEAPSRAFLIALTFRNDQQAGLLIDEIFI